MRVGTSLRGFPLSPFLEDHPHACGDKTAVGGIRAEHLWIIPMRVGTRTI